MEEKRPRTGASTPQAEPSHRFRAVVVEASRNPYVDIPLRVSRSLTEHAHSGRIRVEGRLNTTPIRGTLMPIRDGGHRLYLNGGMRAAARVGVGDSVTIEVTPVAPGSVSTPDDLSAALVEAGLGDSFERLNASYRRELVRYVDDARSPTARQRRVENVLDEVGGVQEPRRTEPPRKPLWTCPKCGNQFVTKNMYHSCERHTIDEPFEDKPPEIRELFDRFREIVEQNGPVTLVAYRNRVAFMVDVRFAGAVPKKRWLDVSLWLPRRFESSRFRKIETLGPRAHVYTLRVTEPADLDDEVAGWIAEAYAVGRRQHLRPSPNDTRT